jgi:hypothetical protein
MENPKNCVTQIKTQLQEISTDLQQIRRDPSFCQWENVDLEKHVSILEAFGINTKRILQTQQKLKREIVTPKKDIAKLENNVGHLAIDIESGDIEEIKAEQQCAILRNETSNNAKIVKNLQQELIFLQDAANTIRKNLTLVKLIPMAQEITVGKKAKHFAIGLSYLSMLEEKSANDPINIPVLLEETAQVEAKLTRLQFPELPDLAETILANHVNACLSTTPLISQYLEKSTYSGTANLKNIEKFTQHINSVAAQSLSEILKSIPGLVKKLRDLVCDLQRYSIVIEKIERINQLVQSLHTFYTALKYDYFQHISKQTKEGGSSLAPHVAAAQETLEYFRGLKGIVRNFRLIFGGPARGEEQPDLYLNNLLTTTIKTCSHYYGSEKTDVANITSFIDGQLVDCPKPFPYDDFFKVIKKTIAVYGENVERNLYHYKIYSSAAQYRDEELSEEDSTSKKKTTFGRVLGKIDLLSKELKSSLTQPEE